MRALVLAVALSALIAGPAVACGSADKGNVDKGKAHAPPLAAVMDKLLPGAELSAADLAKVTALRAEIMKLAAAGKEEAARSRGAGHEDPGLRQRLAQVRLGDLHMDQVVGRVSLPRSVPTPRPNLAGRGK